MPESVSIWIELNQVFRKCVLEWDHIRNLTEIVIEPIFLFKKWQKLLRWDLNLEVISTFLKVLFSSFENVSPQNANHISWELSLLDSFRIPAAGGTAWCEAVAELLTAALAGFRHKKGGISSLLLCHSDNWPTWKRRWEKEKMKGDLLELSY